MPIKDHNTTLQLSSGVTLRYQVARPQDAPERGSILLLQGRGECLEQYAEITGDLTAKGFSVFAFDWRGQGLSTRPLEDRLKCHVHSFDDYLEDLHEFVSRVWQPQASCHYVLTHSMGGHLALRYLAESGMAVDGALLCAPMIGIQTRRWPKAIAPMIIEGMIGLGFAETCIPGSRSYRPSERRFDGNPLTSDEARYAVLPSAVGRNPELEVDGPTFGWVDAAFRSIAVLTGENYVEGIASPVTILVGDADVIIDLEAARGIARRIRNCRFELLHDARHEIMMENDGVRDEFWRRFERMAAP